MDNKLEMARPACHLCRFWCLIPPVRDPVSIGECRRRSPSQGRTNRGVWPDTLATDFCGEFEPVAGKAAG